MLKFTSRDTTDELSGWNGEEKKVGDESESDEPSFSNFHDMSWWKQVFLPSRDKPEILASISRRQAASRKLDQLA